MKKEIIIFITLMLMVVSSTSAADVETNNTTIKLTINNEETTAQMINNPTSDEFLQLLPLELELTDLLNREKYAQLPTTITDNTEKINTYEIGYIAYYQPTNSIAIYYDNDNEEIKEGIIPIAIIKNNTDIFKQNNTSVKIQLVE